MRVLIGKPSLNHYLGKQKIHQLFYLGEKSTNFVCLAMFRSFGLSSFSSWSYGPYGIFTLHEIFKSKLILSFSWTKKCVLKLRSFIVRNAETWLQEQRRRLRWLRAKSIELGIYNPETTLMKENIGRGNPSPKKDSLNKSEKQKTKKAKT